MIVRKAKEQRFIMINFVYKYMFTYVKFTENSM